MTLDACARIVAEGDPDRFLSVMAAPVAARARLLPLYAVNVEIARAPHVSQEPMIGEMRLQWWRDAVAEIAAGAAPRAHEVAAPLAEVIRACDLPVAVLDAAIAARRWDLWREPFEDEAAFLDHLDATSGGLMWLAVKSLGGTDETGARATGRAMGLANWFRAVPAMEARGMKPLPDGRPETVARLAREGLGWLGQGTDGRPALRAAWLAGPILRQAARQPERVKAGALGVSEFRRRASLIGRAALGR